MRTFFDSYDLLLCPATIVPPFPVEQRYVAECDGVKLDSYVDWLMIVHAITLTASPAISIPCGFTADHLPVGLQIMAPPMADDRLYLVGSALEKALVDRWGHLLIEEAPEL